MLVQSNLFSQQRSKYNGNYFRINNLVLLSGPGETLLQEVQVKGIFRMGGICPKIELGIKLRLSSIFIEGNRNSFVHVVSTVMKNTRLFKIRVAIWKLQIL